MKTRFWWPGVRACATNGGQNGLFRGGVGEVPRTLHFGAVTNGAQTLKPPGRATETAPMNTKVSLTARGRLRRRLLQAGWLMGFASVALGFVALVVGSWQLWLTVTILSGLAALAVLLAPGVEEDEVGNEGPAILRTLLDDRRERSAA